MTKACLGNELESFQKSPMDLFILLKSIFRCPSNVNLTSKTTRRCFGELIWETLLLLKSKERCVAFFSFLVNIISWASLLRSGLKVILYWKTQSLIFFFRSLFNSIADGFILCTTENGEVSSAKSLAFDGKSSDKSLI